MRIKKKQINICSIYKMMIKLFLLLFFTAIPVQGAPYLLLNTIDIDSEIQFDKFNSWKQKILKNIPENLLSTTIKEESSSLRLSLSLKKENGLVKMKTSIYRLGTHWEKKLKSTFPIGALNTSVSIEIAAGDILYLLLQFRGFPQTKKLLSPKAVSLLRTDLLKANLNLPEMNPEPIWMEQDREGFIFLFSNYYFHLGKKFEITPYTLRDLTIQNEKSFSRPYFHINITPSGKIILLSYKKNYIIPQNLEILSLKAFTNAFSGGINLKSGEIITQEDERLIQYTESDGQLIRNTIPMTTSIITAITRGPADSFFVFDALEKRIKQYSPKGLPMKTIRPLINLAQMPFPRILEFFEDGSFIIGDYRKLWKCSAKGRPQWVMDSINLKNKAESLPSHFKIFTDSREDSFYLMDPLAKRIIKYADPLNNDEAPSSDGDAPSYIKTLIKDDRIILALQKCLLEGSNKTNPLFREALFLLRKKKAVLLGKYAAELAELGNPAKALEFIKLSIEKLYLLRTEDPGDIEIPRKIDEMKKQRNILRETLK